MTTPEKFASFQRNQFAQAFSLSQNLFNGFEKAVQLNIGAARDSFQIAKEVTEATLSAKTAQDLQAIATKAGKPVYEQAKAYASDVKDIVKASVVDVTAYAEAQRKAILENAPDLANAGKAVYPGSDNVYQMTKSFVDTFKAAAKKATKAA